MKPSFKQTLKFLNAIERINCGGCGVSALAIYDAAKREGKKPKIVYLYHVMWEMGSMLKNNQYKEGKRKTAYSCSHVLIKIGNRYWDSTGVIAKSNLYLYQEDETITREHLVASINNKRAWNEAFNRKYWIPQIQKQNCFKAGTVVKV